MEYTRKTVAIGSNIIKTAICGNKSVFPIFFQSILCPTYLHGKYRTLAYNAFHDDLTLHNVDHSLYKSKTKAVALNGMRGITLIKLLKDMRANLCGHSAAGVSHFYNGVMFCCDKTNRN